MKFCKEQCKSTEFCKEQCKSSPFVRVMEFSKTSDNDSKYTQKFGEGSVEEGF